MMLRPTFQIGISIHALREEGDRKTLQSKRVFMYFYPRPPRGGRHLRGIFLLAGKTISIHALREEGDPYYLAGRQGALQFLSTPSARRAT